MTLKENQYPEINHIHSFIKKYDVVINIINSDKPQNGLTPLTLKLKNLEHVIYMMDEYDDLRFNNPLLNFVLVFRELELIADSTDYLNWCKQQSIDAHNDVLSAYYADLASALPDIAKCFPDYNITSFVSDLDFQLNAGVIQTLRT